MRWSVMVCAVLVALAAGADTAEAQPRERPGAGPPRRASVRSHELRIPRRAPVEYGEAYAAPAREEQAVVAELTPDGAISGRGVFRLRITPAVAMEATWSAEGRGAVRLSRLRPLPGGVRTNVPAAGSRALAAAGVADVGQEVADIEVLGVADVEDEHGRAIARDRAVAILVAGDVAIVAVPGVGWDGRAEPVPGRAGGRLALRYAGVVLAQPSRPPGELVELVARGDGAAAAEVPVGGDLLVRAFDGGGALARRALDRVEALRIRIERADGSVLRVTGVRLDRTHDGGVMVNGAEPSVGDVALAVWGRCDVTDGDNRVVARDAPLLLWITRRGEVHVRVDGLFRVRFR